MSPSPARRFNRGAWEVQRERCRIESERPPPPNYGRDLTAAALVPGILKKMGLAERLWEEQLRNEWEQLVGPQVARQARPGRIDRLTLYIYVRHPGWLSELSRYSQKQILENMQKRFGRDKIRNVRIQLDPDLGRDAR